VPAQSLQTDAFVLLKRPAADAFQSFNLFSAENGPLLAPQRIPRLTVGQAGGQWWTPWWAVVKAGLFVGLMILVGQRLVPVVLNRVVSTRSRERFILVALTLAAGTALAASALFGVSLALGAFVAGVVVSESEFSHQINADLLPFRETFPVLCFVSGGLTV